MVSSPAISNVSLAKDDLHQLKRSEIQALCKANNLRAIGTTGTLIDSLVSYFDGLNMNDSPVGATKTQTVPIRSGSKPVSKAPSSAKVGQRPGSKFVATPSLTPASIPRTPKPTPFPKITTPRSRVSSTSTSAPSPLFTDNDGATQTAPSSDDNQAVSPVIRRVSAPLSASPNMRTMTKTQPKAQLAKPSIPRTDAVGRKLATKASAQSLTVPRDPRGISPASSAATPKKPMSLAARRSLGPSISIPSTQRSKSLSVAPSPPLAINALQSQLAELAASFNRAEASRLASETRTAQCLEAIAQLTERIDVREDHIESQHKIIESQRGSIEYLEDAVEQAKADLRSMYEDIKYCKVDVASAVSQMTTFATAIAELQKRMATLERVALHDDGRLAGLARDMGDVDVAMASDRDRVDSLEQEVSDLALRLNETMGMGTAGPISAGSKGKSRSPIIGGIPPGKKRNPSVARVVERDEESSSTDANSPFGRDRRLSRASISANLHHTAPASTIAFPTGNGGRAIKPPFTGTRQEFRFPPPSRQSTTSFGSAAPRPRLPSAAAGETRTSTPAVSRIHTRTNSVTNDQEDDSMISGNSRSNGFGSTEDEADEPIRPQRISVKRTPPAIVFPGKRVDSGSDDASQAPLSVSISELDGPISGTGSDDDESKEPQSLLHQPQPSFGFLTTDDDDDGRDSDIPPPSPVARRNTRVR